MEHALCHACAGISAELSFSFNKCHWWAWWIRLGIEFGVCGISRQGEQIPSGTGGPRPPSDVKCWLRIQLWVTLQCTITYLCSMQSSLRLQLKVIHSNSRQELNSTGWQEQGRCLSLRNFSSSKTFIFLIYDLCGIFIFSSFFEMSDRGKKIATEQRPATRLLHKFLYVALLYSSPFWASRSFYSWGCSNIYNQRHWHRLKTTRVSTQYVGFIFLRLLPTQDDKVCLIISVYSWMTHRKLEKKSSPGQNVINTF